MTDFVVGLGSNLGSREAFVRTAVRVLASDPRIAVVALSSRYLTPPLGPAQPDFVNAAARLRTQLAPRELLGELLRVEASLGRVRAERWGPRTIDLDVLWWQGGQVRERDLIVPHAGLLGRGFALAPLLEVAPELEPRLGAHLARAGAPPATPWARIERAEVAIEVRALDDADALALALSDLLGGGASHQVGVLSEPTPGELVERACREAKHPTSVLVEALAPGLIQARTTSDPSKSGGPRRASLTSLDAGRCRLALDPSEPKRGEPAGRPNKLL